MQQVRNRAKLDRHCLKQRRALGYDPCLFGTQCFRLLQAELDSFSKAATACPGAVMQLTRYSPTLLILRSNEANTKFAELRLGILLFVSIGTFAKGNRSFCSIGDRITGHISHSE